jgi:anti-sigma regulatory factor (Ser/Thr protein kinase)
MSDPRELSCERSGRRFGPLELRMPADPHLVSAIRLTASAVAAAGKCTIAEIDDVKLAISEVLLALIEHGSGRELSVSIELADSTFAISGSTETLTFDRSHPDLALCDTVLAEVSRAHSIELVGSELCIIADVHLSRSDDR